MRKEIVIAVILGLGLGLMITYGFYRARQAFTNPDYNSIVLQESSPSPEATALSSLSIISPNDELIVSDSTVPVTGTTVANNYVVIFVNDHHYVTTADATGNFSITVTLDTGSNIIIVHALDENGTETTVERTVILTSASPVPTASPSASPSAKPSASPKSSATPKATPKP